MKVPVWYHVLWIIAALASAFVCVQLFRSRLMKQWPFLFLLCANDFLFTLASELNPSGRYHYARYFWLYWWDSAVTSLIFVGLALDVVRAMPSFAAIPARLKIGVASTVVLVGTLWALATASARGSMGIAKFVVIMNRTVNFTWSVMAMALIASIAMTGFGYSRLGARVATGALIRLISSLIVSYALTTSFARHLRYLNSIDTAVALWSSAYWFYSIRRSRADDHRNTDLWKRTPIFNQAEKDSF